MKFAYEHVGIDLRIQGKKEDFYHSVNLLSDLNSSFLV